MKRRMMQVVMLMAVLLTVGFFYQKHVKANWNTITGLDAEVYVSGGNGFASTNTIVRRFTTVNLNVGNSITYADDAVYGASFLINTPGVYSIHYSDQRTDNAYPGFLYYIEVDHSPVQSTVSTIVSGSTIGMVGSSNPGSVGNIGLTLLLDAGDVVRPWWWGNVGGTYNNGVVAFVITKVR